MICKIFIQTSTAVALSAGLMLGASITTAAWAGGANTGHVVDGAFITDAYTIRHGGRLYANWGAELGVDLPKTTHPSYPAAGKKKGATTWRCKECHGWDQKGKDGAYSHGSHFSGIKGIGSYAMKSPDDLITTLRDKVHQYTPGMLPDGAISDISHFLAFGRVNTDAFINPKTKLVQGDTRHGAEIYQTVCSVCHGLDGKLINFHTAKDPEYVGTVAKGNPWEGLHNIRFGAAGNAMVGLFPFTLQDQLDVLAYAQTLPAK